MSQKPQSPSIDELVNATRSSLKENVERAKVPISLSVPTVSFWIEKSSLLEVQEFVQVKYVSDIQVDSKINIELEFGIGDIVYKLVMRTVVSKNGIFTLRHSDVVDISYPYTDQDMWELVKSYAKANALPIAGLMLSLLNTSLNLMRLKPP